MQTPPPSMHPLRSLSHPCPKVRFDYLKSVKLSEFNYSDVECLGNAKSYKIRSVQTPHLEYLLLYIKRNIKGTVDVISNDPSFIYIEWHV